MGLQGFQNSEYALTMKGQPDMHFLHSVRLINVASPPHHTLACAKEHSFKIKQTWVKCSKHLG